MITAYPGVVNVYGVLTSTEMQPCLGKGWISGWESVMDEARVDCLIIGGVATFKYSTKRWHFCYKCNGLCGRSNVFTTPRIKPITKI